MFLDFVIPGLIPFSDGPFNLPLAAFALGFAALKKCLQFRIDLFEIPVFDFQ